jgi:hypothetical protein
MADVDFTPTLTRKPAKARKAQIPINLASLPREEALRCARIAGRAFLDDPEALQAVIDEIAMKWVDDNMSSADGQADGEFANLGDALEAEFSGALLAGLQKPQAHPGDMSSSDPLLERLDKLLGQKSVLAWKLHNVLAFMVEALPTDTEDGLPTQCMLVELRCDMDQLASGLQDLMWSARKEVILHE